MYGKLPNISDLGTAANTLSNSAYTHGHSAAAHFPRLNLQFPLALTHRLPQTLTYHCWVLANQGAEPDCYAHQYQYQWGYGQLVRNLHLYQRLAIAIIRQPVIDRLFFLPPFLIIMLFCLWI